jgi:hypothetical protein
MNPKSQEPKAAGTARPASDATREARLKVALKANMARRKAQAKARSGMRDGAETGDAEASPPENE